MLIVVIIRAHSGRVPLYIIKPGRRVEPGTDKQGANRKSDDRLHFDHIVTIPGRLYGAPRRRHEYPLKSQQEEGGGQHVANQNCDSNEPSIFFDRAFNQQVGCVKSRRARHDHRTECANEEKQCYADIGIKKTTLSGG